MIPAHSKKYIDACLSGDIDTVEYLIKHENRVLKNKKLLYKYLQNACEGGHSDIFDIIYEYGHHRKILDDKNILTMMFDRACVGGNITLVNKLVEISRDVPDIDMSREWTRALRNTCYDNGNLEIVKYYINNISHDGNLTTHIHDACRSGNVDLINFILSRFKDNCSKLDEGRDEGRENEIIWDLCLRNACCSGNLEAVCLIDDYRKSYGVIFDSYNWSEFLETACERKNIEIVQFVIENGATNFSDCLHNACKGGCEEIIDLLIENIQHTTHGQGPFMDDLDDGLTGACYGGHMDIVKLMASKGSTNWNWGLRHACFSNNVEIVKFLIKKGANLWNIGLENARVASYSSYSDSGNLEIMKLMVVNGATEHLDACFTEACSKGDINFIKILLKKGIVIWKNGIQCACKNGHIDVIKLLLKHGATSSNSDFNSGILANDGNDPYIDNLLIKNGADYECLKNTNDFNLYRLYCRYCCDTESDSVSRYMDLLTDHPPCVLLVGCRITGSGKCCVNKLPNELFRLLSNY